MVNTKRFNHYYTSKSHDYNTGSGDTTNLGLEAVSHPSEPPVAYQIRLRFKSDEHSQNHDRTIFLRTYAGDLQMFYEVIWERSYKIPALDAKRGLTIIDAGANIGFTSLFFARRFYF